VAASGDDVCAVGAHGTILYSGDGGASFSAESSKTTADLRAVTFVHGTAEELVAGDGGAVLRYDDAAGAWNTLAVPTTADLRAAWSGVGVADLLVAGSGGTVVRIPAPLPDTTDDAPNAHAAPAAPAVVTAHGDVTGLAATWTDDQQWIYAVAGSTSPPIPTGNEPPSSQPTQYQISRSQNGGVTWDELDGGSRFALNAIWATGPDDVWAVGTGGTVLHSKDGVTFTPVASGTHADLHAVWGRGPTDVYVVGDGGTLLHSTDWGVTLQAVPQPGGVKANLRGLAGSAKSIVIVGDGGTVLSGP
jgi:photosystem II stability/assembly factor-like uncharacterized protein